MRTITPAELLKQLDRTIGRVLCACLPSLSAPSQRKVRSSVKRILVIRPGGIGDAVLLAPAIHALSQQFPGASLDVLAEKRNMGGFGLCPAIHRLYVYDRPTDLLRVIRTKYDVVIDTEQWHRLSAVVARLIRAPVCIGYDTNERRRLYTHLIPYNHDRYEGESFLDLLEPLRFQRRPEVAPQFLEVPEVEGESVRELELFSGKPFVTIFPGASILERRWGVDNFAKLVERLYSVGLRVVVIGGREDIAQGEKIVAVKYGLNLAGRTSLSETAVVIARSALLVSGDSGILHIGVGLDKPTVSLFGPGIAKKWAPCGEKHIVINKKLPCSPCTKFGYTPKCPIDARCMSEISVEEVTVAVIELFEKYGKRR